MPVQNMLMPSLRRIRIRLANVVFFREKIKEESQGLLRS